MTIITLIVTLQLLNISVDPADPNSSREDLSINEIESCVELILEVILNKADAVKESDDQDEAACQPVGTMIVLVMPGSHIIVNDIRSETFVVHLFADKNIAFESRHQSISAPPPKVA